MDKLRVAASWLTDTANILPGPKRRRANLLAWVLLSILVLIIVSFLVVLTIDLPGNTQQHVYLWLIGGLLVPETLAYGLNRRGHFHLSGGLLLACAVIGPWGSMLLDPIILAGDFVPLNYVLLPVLLSSILFRPTITFGLAAFQLLALLLVPLFSPASALINWPSFLIFVFMTFLLCILANVISRNDMEQIDRQTTRLVLSEAGFRDVSIHDHLTSLFNRRHMQEELERLVQLADRDDTPLGIIILDIDHFKRVNDRLGHAGGDLVLQELGKLLAERVRKSDVACRYGGEEFVLLLPDTSQDVTRERAKQLRTQVQQLHIEYQHQWLEPLTISLGVAMFPEHGSTCDALLLSADDALYQAKEKGRDCVVVAGAYINILNLTSAKGTTS